MIERIKKSSETRIKQRIKIAREIEKSFIREKILNTYTPFPMEKGI